jgi:hypothetical protein
MFQLLPGFPDDVLAIAATGKVTADDYEKTLAPAVEERMHRQGPLKLFFHFGPGFEGLEVGALVEDLRLSFAHWREWGRVAVVTDSGALRDAIGFFALTFRHPLQLFFNADYDKAKAWIEERQDEQAS